MIHSSQGRPAVQPLSGRSADVGTVMPLHHVVAVAAINRFQWVVCYLLAYCVNAVNWFLWLGAPDC